MDRGVRDRMHRVTSETPRMFLAFSSRSIEATGLILGHSGRKDIFKAQVCSMTKLK